MRRLLAILALALFVAVPVLQWCCDQACAPARGQASTHGCPHEAASRAKSAVQGDQCRVHVKAPATLVTASVTLSELRGLPPSDGVVDPFELLEAGRVVVSTKSPPGGPPGTFVPPIRV